MAPRHLCVSWTGRKPEISDFSNLDSVSRAQWAAEAEASVFQSLCIRSHKSPGLVRLCLSLHALCHCGYIVPPSGDWASWAGSDGGDASIAQGAPWSHQMCMETGQAQGSQLARMWEGCNPWVWGTDSVPQSDISSLIAPWRTQCRSEETEGQVRPLAGQMEQAGHFCSGH